MIVAERKPFDEILSMIGNARKVLILGCGSCVTVCMAGGEKETQLLASTIRLSDKKQNITRELRCATIERQCDKEFFAAVANDVKWADIIVSMACGVGVQFCGEVFTDKEVVPALNTKFYGATVEQGVWSERCVGCGDCVLFKFGGICPIARCSKSLLNGPCGGSQNGMCEVDPENIQCGWQLIYDRMAAIGRLDLLEQNQPLKNWSTGRDGGPRRVVKEDATL
ncbi:MAG: methylenetetrahydrofolate reductase C-terminal domain-containing protein [Lentisphaerae bacterium]|nr:methylenetetrahydrofolate reductase C-terminal domain-containing protein [Lentisphaerota bacterium]